MDGAPDLFWGVGGIAPQPALSLPKGQTMEPSDMGHGFGVPDDTCFVQLGM